MHSSFIDDSWFYRLYEAEMEFIMPEQISDDFNELLLLSIKSAWLMPITGLTLQVAGVEALIRYAIDNFIPAS